MTETTHARLDVQFQERLSELRTQYGAEPLKRVEAFVDLITGKQKRPALDPLQQPELYFFPDITNRAWHDTPPAWMPRLEAATPTNRNELEALLAAPTGFVPHVHGADSDYRAEKFKLEKLSERWTVYDLHKEEAERECPSTLGLMREIFREDLGEPVTAQFSALRPGSRIAPHCGVANFFLTAHLGLVTPESCRLRVGSEARGWSEGKGFVFDDSFEHEVWHEGTETRVVLLFRFWHPELTPTEIECIGALHEKVIDVAGGTESEQRKALEALRGEA
jgi:aspartyl/asparaginyl beta-hydroxylase (cupin superfamily)